MRRSSGSAQVRLPRCEYSRQPTDRPTNARTHAPRSICRQLQGRSSPARSFTRLVRWWRQKIGTTFFFFFALHSLFLLTSWAKTASHVHRGQDQFLHYQRESQLHITRKLRVAPIKQLLPRRTSGPGQRQELNLIIHAQCRRGGGE